MKKEYFSGLALVGIFVILRSLYVPTYKFLTGAMHPFSISLFGTIAFLIVFWSLNRGGPRKFWLLKKFERIEYFKLLLPAMAGGIMLDLAIFYLPVKAFAVLISMLPIVVGIYSIPLLKEHPSPALWVAAFLAGFGAMVFKTSGVFEIGAGDFLIFFGVLLFGLAPIINRKFVKKIGTYEIIIINSAAYLIPFLILNFIFGTFSLPPFDLFYISVLFANIFIIGITTVTIAVSVMGKIQPNVFVTLTTALIPLGAMLLGIAWLGETIEVNEMIGGVIMIGSAVLAAKFGK